MDASKCLLGLSLSDWDHLAKSLALLAALVFFAYKAISGYMVTNMSLKLACTRQPSNKGNLDDLALSITLLKGDRGSVAIHDATVRLYGADGVGLGPIPLTSIDRLTLDPDSSGNANRKKVAWDTSLDSKPCLNLTPGDEMTLSSYCQVSSAGVWRAEVVVLGRRVFSPFVAQWRGSLIALPLTPKERHDATGRLQRPAEVRPGRRR
jgi:hypothetical protein